MKEKQRTKSILVSGASGIVGYGILKSLKQSNLPYKLIGTTIYENSVADAFSDVCEKAPPTNEPTYLSWLIEIIKKHQINIIIPAIEIDVMYWKNFKPILEQQTGVCVMLNNPNLIELCEDKWLFYQELKRHKSPYAIKTELKLNKNGLKFPFLLKPRKGYGSKGIVIVKDNKMLSLHKNEIGPNLMVQNIIGSMDEEYTTAAFFDKNSNLCAHISLKRTLSKEGFTETAETIEIKNIDKALTNLAKIFKPIGPTNFQFRKYDKQLKLLEINPRISSSTSIRARFGFNESAMSVEYFLNNKKPIQPKLTTGRAIRYTEDIIYYDSTNF